MAIRVEWESWYDASLVVDALLAQSDALRVEQPTKAVRLRGLADSLGDALDVGQPEPNHPTRPCGPHQPGTWCGVCGWPETHMLPAVEPLGIVNDRDVEYDP